MTATLLWLAAGLLVLLAVTLGPDLVGRIVLGVEGQFRNGDRVCIGEEEGRVLAIGLRATRLRTGDGEILSVPHRRLLSATVRNADAPGASARVVTEMALPPDADLGEARRLAHEAAASSRFVHLGSPVDVALEGPPDAGPGFVLRVRARPVDPGDAGRLRTEILEGLQAALREG